MGRRPINEHAEVAAVEAERQRQRRIPPEELAAAELGDLDAPNIEPRRPKRPRKPFGAHEQRLIFPARAGYHSHWFNDEPGRLARAEEAGYEFRHDPRTSKPVSTIVGTARGGGGLTAYLMDIPQEWYDEDMAAQEAVVLEMKQQILDGSLGVGDIDKRDAARRYAGSATKGDIRIQEGNRR